MSTDREHDEYMLRELAMAAKFWEDKAGSLRAELDAALARIAAVEKLCDDAEREPLRVYTIPSDHGLIELVAVLVGPLRSALGVERPTVQTPAETCDQSWITEPVQREWDTSADNGGVHYCFNDKHHDGPCVDAGGSVRLEPSAGAPATHEYVQAADSRITHCIGWDEWKPGAMRVCASCGGRPAHDTQHAARGLCNRCYQRHLRNGTIERFPRRLRRYTEVVDEYRFLTAAGFTRQQVADALGLHIRSIERALAAARRSGYWQDTGVSAG